MTIELKILDSEDDLIAAANVFRTKFGPAPSGRLSSASAPTCIGRLGVSASKNNASAGDMGKAMGGSTFR